MSIDPEALTAVRDAVWHAEETAACLRAAVLADPTLVTRLGVAHAATRDLLDLLRERVR